MKIRFMSPALTACYSMVFYAITNVIIEQRLAKYATPVLMLYFSLSCLPLIVISLVYIRAKYGEIVMPIGIDIALLILVGVLYFLADIFYLCAYTNGGSLLTITTVVALFPVFASVIKYLWCGGVPNTYQIAGYVLAFAAVLLVAYGSPTPAVE